MPVLVCLRSSCSHVTEVGGREVSETRAEGCNAKLRWQSCYTHHTRPPSWGHTLRNSAYRYLEVKVITWQVFSSFKTRDKVFPKQGSEMSFALSLKEAETLQCSLPSVAKHNRCFNLTYNVYRTVHSISHSLPCHGTFLDCKLGTHLSVEGGSRQHSAHPRPTKPRG